MALERGKRERFVIDACALIAYFNDEEGASVVTDILNRARGGEIDLYAASVNIYELYYDCLKRDAEMAQELLSDIRELPVVVVETLDDSLMQFAGRYKTYYRLSLADSIALGLAQQLDAYLVSSDHHEFDVVEADGAVRLYWIR